MQNEFYLWIVVGAIAILLDYWYVQWLRRRRLEGKPPLRRQLSLSFSRFLARFQSAVNSQRLAAEPAGGSGIPSESAPLDAPAPLAAPMSSLVEAQPAQAMTTPLPEALAETEATAPAAPGQDPAPAVSPVASSPSPEVQLTRVEANATMTASPGGGYTPQENIPGVSRVHISLEMAPGTRVRLTVESLGDSSTPVTVISEPAEPTVALAPARPEPAGQAAQISAPPRAARARPINAPAIRLPAFPNIWAPLQPAWIAASATFRAQTAELDQVLFWLGLLLYLGTRFIGIDRFPIYFFSDEAVQTVLAANFVRDGFANYLGEVLPTYFQNGTFWNLSVSVYAQVLPYLLFGQSILVTRGTSVLVTVLAVVSVGLILKQIFKASYWWAGVLLLSIAPAWFLHSRTAFETAEMTALYAGFLYAYLLYRYRSPRYLYITLVLGALAFYAYSPGQLVMVATGLLLFISDFRYHYANRAMTVNALTLAAILALPYARFRLAHPEAMYEQLRERGSLLVDPHVPWADKLAHTFAEFRYGLSIAYWYLPNGRDLSRHVMAGYGNLPLFTLPFALLGLAKAIRNFRSPAYRAVLIALVASPTGGALAEIGVTRVLMFVIPATLLAALGLATALEWLEKRRAPRAGLAMGVFVLLAGINIYMLRDALTNGPLWFRDYGLGGMQYGAKQLFQDVIPDLLRRDPQVRVSVSSSWANSPDLFPQFFLTPVEQSRVLMLNLDYFLQEQRNLPPNLLLVMTSDEYKRAVASPKLKSVEVTEVMPYPDGTPGFYFTHIAYADNIAEVFEAERVARAQLVTEEFVLDGQTVTVGYSSLGGGALHDMFDGDRFTLARGYEANPFVIEITYPEPRTISHLSADFGSMPDFTVTVKLYETEAASPVVYSETYRDLPPDPHIDMELEGGPEAVSKVRLEIMNNTAGDVANIHVREVSLK